MVRDGKGFHAEKKREELCLRATPSVGVQRGSERGGQSQARSVVTDQALYWLTGYNGLLAAWRGQDGGDGAVGRREGGERGV